MSGPLVALLVHQMDRSFDRIRTRLGGLSDEEFFWEPFAGCWTIHRRRPEDRTWEPGVREFVNGKGEWVSDYAIPDLDPAPFTTIAWRLVHAGGINWMYHEHVFGPGKMDWDDYELPHTASDAVAWWEAGYRRFRDALAETPDDGLSRVGVAPWGDTRTVEEWSVVMLDENVHHLAEVGVLRDLYRARRPQSVAG
jgi:hypothetical protein